MSNIRDEIRTFDFTQLNSLQDFVGSLISAKEEEAKRVVWRVCSGGICWGNFREEDYLKAAEFLLQKAKEIHTDPVYDLRDRTLEIHPEKVVESEYESWFRD